MRMIGAISALVAICSTAAAAQAQRPPREDFTEYLPPGEGKALVAAQCSSCHELKGTVQLRHSKQEWEAVVLDMVARGAPLTIEEADAIIGYLSTVFDTSAPPVVEVNTAARADLIKLPGVTPALADRLIAHRAAKGPITSRETVRAVLGLDEPSFARMKWYLKVTP
jgi:DNA uptake protein ComE-like DNA-binding protein